MLGFRLDAWDYAISAALFVLVAAVAIFVVWLAGLPGRIAVAHKHPDAARQSAWLSFRRHATDR